MEVVVTRLLGVVAAWVTHAVVDSVPPVVVVVCRGAVPAPILRLEGIVGPPHTCILGGDDDTLTGVAQCPHGRSIDVLHSPLGGVWAVGWVRGDCEWRGRGASGCGRIIDPAGGIVGVDGADVRAGSQSGDEVTIA
jgi:hypothetical protein